MRKIGPSRIWSWKLSGICTRVPEQVKRCEKINGVSRHVLYVLMAEVGTDLHRFPVAPHVSSWAGVCPGESGKCRQATRAGRCKKGNRSVREVLVQAAHGVRRSHTYLGERYRRKIKTARQ